MNIKAINGVPIKDEKARALIDESMSKFDIMIDKLDLIISLLNGNSGSIIKTYYVTPVLANATLSNPVLFVTESSSYETIISANIGYSISSVSVLMGDSNITSSAYNSTTKTISIPVVTDNITITVTTIEVEDAESSVPSGAILDADGFYIIDADGFYISTLDSDDDSNDETFAYFVDLNDYQLLDLNGDSLITTDF